jgi:hypothetical protein
VLLRDMGLEREIGGLWGENDVVEEGIRRIVIM